MLPVGAVEVYFAVVDALGRGVEGYLVREVRIRMKVLMREGRLVLRTADTLVWMLVGKLGQTMVGMRA